MIGEFANDPLIIYDINYESSITMSNISGTDVASIYLIKYDKQGTPIWATKFGAQTDNTYTSNYYSNLFVSNSSIYVTFHANMDVSLTKHIHFYNVNDQITPALTITLPSSYENINNIGVFAKYNLDGEIQFANYIGLLNTNGNIPARPSISIGTDQSLYIVTNVDPGITINIYDALQNIGLTSIYNGQTNGTLFIKYDATLTPEWLSYNDAEWSFSSIMVYRSL